MGKPTDSQPVPPCTPAQELKLYGLINDDPYAISRNDYDCKLNPTLPYGFQKYVNKETGNKLPHYCEYHRNLFSKVKSWFDQFPNCCPHHKKLADENKIKKTDYEFLLEKIVIQVAQTEYLIEQEIKKRDWYKRITGYIDHQFLCFGIYGIGLNVYLDSISRFLKQSDDIPSERASQIIEYIIYVGANYKYDVLGKGFFAYNDQITQTLLNTFPFNLEIFKQHPLISQDFTIPLPYDVKTKGFEIGSINYTLSKQNLVEYLRAKTLELITSINALTLYKQGKLTDPEKMKLDLVLSERKLQIEKIDYSSEPGSSEYISMLEKWFTEEIVFLDKLAPLVKDRKDLLPKRQPMPDFLKKHYEAMNEQGYDIPNEWLIDDPSNIQEEETSPQSSSTGQIIEDIFAQMGSKGTYGWEYAFRSGADYSQYVSLLEAHFQHLDYYELPRQIIPLRPGSKSQIAIALGSIHKELGEQLKGDNAFFKLVRVLSHFHEADDETLYKDLSRRRD